MFFFLGMDNIQHRCDAVRLFPGSCISTTDNLKLNHSMAKQNGDENENDALTMNSSTYNSTYT